MAAKTNCQTLSELRKRIRETELNGNRISTNEFMVISIHRYLSDPKHKTQIGARLGEQSDVLDVIELTIGDGKHKVKVILASDLNRLVQTCKAGHMVVLTGCKVHYDETDLSSGKIVIVQSLDITGYKEIHDKTDLNVLQWADDCSYIEQMDIPLTSSRGYYISVWSTMDMYGNIWKTTAQVVNGMGSTKPQDIYHIKDLTKSSIANKATDPALLVRVLLKSRMLHYGKVGKNDKWPFQAHLLIGDKTGACTAVLWNAMCPNLYHCIKEGTVLLLRKFKAKKSFTVLPRFRPLLKDTQFYDVDINLNSHHPESEVKVIEASDLPDGIELPPLQYNFVTRRQAGCLPNNYNCDIAGVVTYVGRYERESMHNKFGCDFGGFWVRRWLQLRDSSSNKPHFIQLYRTAEGLEEVDIQPGTLLVCTHMRLVNREEHIESSLTGMDMFTTTTAESQISILDDDFYKTLKAEKVITSLWKWSRTRQCKDMLTHASIGGYINYPHLPGTLEELQSCFNDWQITPSGDWEKVLTGLSFRECRQLLVQATMAHVRLSLTNLHSHRHAVEEVTVDKDVMDNVHSLASLGNRQLDEDISFPVAYKTDQWSVVKRSHQFLATELQTSPNTINNKSDLEYRMRPYYSITWAGLNTRIVLQTHLIPPDNLPNNTTFIDLLGGNTSVGYSRHSIEPTVSTLGEVLSSADQCRDKRFLLVLDCYQGDVENTEIVLNRALVL